MTLLALINGLMLLRAALGAAMIAWWWPCLWRVIRQRPVAGDAGRATWLPFAFGSVLLGLNTVNQNLAGELSAKVFLAANLCMVTTMLFAIYIKGRDVQGFKLGRVMSVHLALLFACIAAAAYAA